jgi:hypothetical protein
MLVLTGMAWKQGDRGGGGGENGRVAFQPPLAWAQQGGYN